MANVIRHKTVPPDMQLKGMHVIIRPKLRSNSSVQNKSTQDSQNNASAPKEAQVKSDKPTK